MNESNQRMWEAAVFESGGSLFPCLPFGTCPLLFLPLTPTGSDLSISYLGVVPASCPTPQHPGFLLFSSQSSSPSTRFTSEDVSRVVTPHCLLFPVPKGSSQFAHSSSSLSDALPPPHSPHIPPAAIIWSHLWNTYYMYFYMDDLKCHNNLWDLWGRYDYYSHFIEKKTKAQKHVGPDPKSPN